MLGDRNANKFPLPCFAAHERKGSKSGEGFEAKFGRHGFRRNFVFEGEWNGKYYGTKQLEVYTVEEVNSLLVITVLVKYF